MAAMNVLTLFSKHYNLDQYANTLALSLSLSNERRNEASARVLSLALARLCCSCELTCGYPNNSNNSNDPE